MPASTTPKLLAVWMARAVERKLGLSPLQVRADEYERTPLWQGAPIVQVVPGGARPYRSGRGAQSGGGVLLREQDVSLHVYCRDPRDEYDSAESLLTADGMGLLDLAERVRQVFSSTMLYDGANPPPVIEPFWYAGEDKPVVADDENHVVRKTVRIGAAYATSTATSPSASVGDVT